MHCHNPAVSLLPRESGCGSDDDESPSSCLSHILARSIVNPISRAEAATFVPEAIVEDFAETVAEP